jgi:hypothetical protein
MAIVAIDLSLLSSTQGEKFFEGRPYNILNVNPIT